MNFDDLVKRTERKVIEERYFKYSVPEDKELQLYDFYVLSYLKYLITQPAKNFRDLPTDLEDTIKDAVKVLYPTLRQELLNAVFYSVCAEMRHFSSYSGNEQMFLSKYDVEDKKLRKILNYYLRYRKYNAKDTNSQKEMEEVYGVEKPSSDVRPPESEVNNDKDRNNSFKAAKYAVKQAGATDADFVRLAERAYSEGQWYPSYGGKAWANICKGYLRLNAAEKTEQVDVGKDAPKIKTSAEDMGVAIDHVYDLQHNTDTVFNKLKSYYKKGYGWLGKALDYKANVKSYYDLLKHASPLVRQIAPPVLYNKLGQTWEQRSNELNPKQEQFPTIPPSTPSHDAVKDMGAGTPDDGNLSYDDVFGNDDEDIPSSTISSDEFSFDPNPNNYIEHKGAKIRVGDLVKCIDAPPNNGKLEEGKIYRITKVAGGDSNNSNQFVNIADQHGVELKATGWAMHRFVKVIPKNSEEVYDKYGNVVSLPEGKIFDAQGDWNLEGGPYGVGDYVVCKNPGNWDNLKKGDIYKVKKMSPDKRYVDIVDEYGKGMPPRGFDISRFVKVNYTGPTSDKFKAFNKKIASTASDTPKEGQFLISKTNPDTDIYKIVGVEQDANGELQVKTVFSNPQGEMKGSANHAGKTSWENIKQLGYHLSDTPKLSGKENIQQKIKAFAQQGQYKAKSTNTDIENVIIGDIIYKYDQPSFKFKVNDVDFGAFDPENKYVIAVQIDNPSNDFNSNLNKLKAGGWKIVKQGEPEQTHPYSVGDFISSDDKDPDETNNVYYVTDIDNESNPPIITTIHVSNVKNYKEGNYKINPKNHKYAYSADFWKGISDDNIGKTAYKVLPKVPSKKRASKGDTVKGAMELLNKKVMRAANKNDKSRDGQIMEFTKDYPVGTLFYDNDFTDEEDGTHTHPGYTIEKYIKEDDGYHTVKYKSNLTGIDMKNNMKTFMMNFQQGHFVTEHPTGDKSAEEESNEPWPIGTTIKHISDKFTDNGMEIIGYWGDDTHYRQLGSVTGRSKMNTASLESLIKKGVFYVDNKKSVTPKPARKNKKPFAVGDQFTTPSGKIYTVDSYVNGPNGSRIIYINQAGKKIANTLDIFNSWIKKGTIKPYDDGKI